jgi:arylsulfatase A-like enzyme
VYLAHQTVHTHCAAPGEVVKQYLTEKRKPSGKFPHEGINNATYLAMIKHLDNETGRLLKALKEMSLDKNTLVVFLSDNGGAARVTTNDPLRRGKCTSYEGGIRVPMLVSWPGVIRAGSVCDQAVHASLDLYPTLLDAAGGQKKQGQVLDGKNLMPLLKETGAVTREAIFWHAPHYLAHPGNHFRVTPHSAVRKGDFKLIEFFHDYFAYDEPARAAIKHATDEYAPYPIDCATYVPKGKVELFNLRKDLGEQNDLSSEMPEKVAELKTLLARWRKSVGAQMPVKNPRFNPTFTQPRKK